MPRLLLEEVTIYKTPSQRPETHYEDFRKGRSLLKGSQINYFYVPKNENPEFIKWLESQPHEKIFLDKLYSIDDIKIDEEDFPGIKKNLPETLKIPAIDDKKFEELYQEYRDEFERAERKNEYIGDYTRKLATLRKLRDGVFLKRSDMIYLLQLTDEGWIYSADPLRVFNLDSNWLTRLEDLLLIQIKRFESRRGRSYVRLTEMGVSIQEKIRRKMKEGTSAKTD